MDTLTVGQLEYRHLHYFVAVVQERGFRAAALRLRVSQPPLTRQIQQLEELLGVVLLLRTPRGIELTAAGTIFFDEAQNILALTNQSVDRARLAGQGRLGRLDIGVFGSAVLDVIPRIITAFRKAYPNVDVVLHTMDREAQIQALRERRITVGFNRFFEAEPDLTWEVLHEEHLLVAIPSTNPLAKKKRVSLADLENEPLVFYPRVTRPSGFTNYLLGKFHERGVTPNVVHEVDEVVTAVAFVSSGLGLTIVVESARTLQMPNVTYVRLSTEDQASFALCMIRLTEDKSPLLDAFMDVARTCDKRAPR